MFVICFLLFLVQPNVIFRSHFRLKHDHLEALFDEEFYEFAARYKFTLAFENADCEDYITEKLWRPLIVGSVPIYYGSPTFKVIKAKLSRKI